MAVDMIAQLEEYELGDDKKKSEQEKSDLRKQYQSLALDIAQAKVQEITVELLRERRQPDAETIAARLMHGRLNEWISRLRKSPCYSDMHVKELEELARLQGVRANTSKEELAR